MKPERLRLVTLNSWKGDGLYSRRLELMVVGLKQLQPDIVCLQEALRTEDFRMDTAGYLANELGLQVTYGPGRFKLRSVEGEELLCHSGLAILSRFKPFSHKLTKLPACADDPDRTMLSALFDWRGLLLAISTVHLTHLADENELRERQLSRALDVSHLFASQFMADNRRYLSLCCGDMNWDIDAATRAGMQSKSGIAFEDCYLAGGGELPGNTFGLDEESPCRIDYIFNLQGEEHPSVRFRNGRVVLLEKNTEGLTPSDHLGVMIDMELP